MGWHKLKIVTVILVGISPLTRTQSISTRPEFEVASVKVATGCQNGPVPQEPFRPGRLQFACMSLDAMIQFAYGTFANGTSRTPEAVPTAGLPDWDRSERFAVDAKAPEGTRVEMMAGPMLRALLEDRFKLTVHREVRQVPVYALSFGKESSELRHTKEGGCVPLDPSHPPQNASDGPHICGNRSRRQSPDGTYSFDFYGMRPAEICRFIERVVDRPVIDKTGLAGRFDFHLLFSVEDRYSSLAPDIFSAVKAQLGLKLASQRGPVEFLVIDHVERPSDN